MYLILLFFLFLCFGGRLVKEAHGARVERNIVLDLIFYGFPFYSPVPVFFLKCASVLPVSCPFDAVFSSHVMIDALHSNHHAASSKDYVTRKDIPREPLNLIPQILILHFPRKHA